MRYYGFFTLLTENPVLEQLHQSTFVRIISFSLNRISSLELIRVCLK